MTKSEKLRAMWADPEVRKSRSAKMRAYWSDPEWAARTRQAHRKAVTTPEWREKNLAGAEKSRATRPYNERHVVRWTPEMIAMYLQCKDAGMSQRAMARAIGVAPNTLLGAIKRGVFDAKDA